MPRACQLTLSAEQRETLEEMRTHHPKAYMRERASALLKIADGQSIRAVAAHGVLKARSKDTVTNWVKQYRSHGIAALRVKGGRGRKPAFSPSAHDGGGG